MVRAGGKVSRSAKERQFVIYPTDVQKRYLEKYASKSRTSMNEVVRQSIDLHRTLGGRPEGEVSSDAVWWARVVSSLPPEVAREVASAVAAMVRAITAAESSAPPTPESAADTGQECDRAPEPNGGQAKGKGEG